MDRDRNRPVPKEWTEVKSSVYRFDADAQMMQEDRHILNLYFSMTSDLKNPSHLNLYTHHLMLVSQFFIKLLVITPLFSVITGS